MIEKCQILFIDLSTVVIVMFDDTITTLLVVCTFCITEIYLCQSPTNRFGNTNNQSKIQSQPQQATYQQAQPPLHLSMPPQQQQPQQQSLVHQAAVAQQPPTPGGQPAHMPFTVLNTPSQQQFSMAPPPAQQPQQLGELSDTCSVAMSYTQTGLNKLRCRKLRDCIVQYRYLLSAETS